MQDNYLLQAKQAKACFLSYDQDLLILKHGFRADPDFFYSVFLGDPYRISRKTGDMEYFYENTWRDGNSHGEVMTLLDLICDSSDSRHICGRLKNMQAFGHQFHQNLGEQNPQALLFQDCPEKLKAACEALGGIPFQNGDIAYTIPVFEDLSITLQFWLGDEEFAPRIRYLWDENALQYLKYETMYFAVDVLIAKIKRYL